MSESQPQSTRGLFSELLDREWTDEELASNRAAWEQHVARERERIEREEQQARQRRRSKQITACGVPRKDVTRILTGTIERTEAMDWAHRFVAQLDGDNARCMLVLSGAPGCGKTTAAAWAMVEHIERWASAEHGPLFVHVSRLTRWNRFDDAAMARLECASALVIDDLGAEFLDAKGAFGSFVDGVMNERYAQSLPTIVTTNANAQTFGDRYGARFSDRLREAGRFVELRGASMRGRQGA